MNVNASPLVPAIQPDTTLAAMLEMLSPHDARELVFAYSDGSQVRAGYHVTEVKAGSFVTLDCGGNADAWNETILQVEDLDTIAGETAMTVGKFRSILAAVGRKVRLDGGSRLTIEVSRLDEPMRIYDVAGIAIEGERTIVRLAARPAICKPRHRAQQDEASACCGPSAGKGGCCA